MKYANNVTELVGNTPLVKLQDASKVSGATVLGKCEFMNPSSSVKDRIGFINSHLHKTVAPLTLLASCSFTNGVFPTNSVTLFAYFILFTFQNYYIKLLNSL